MNSRKNVKKELKKKSKNPELQDFRNHKLNGSKTTLALGSLDSKLQEDKISRIGHSADERIS